MPDEKDRLRLELQMVDIRTTGSNYKLLKTHDLKKARSVMTRKNIQSLYT
jgi:hypothetical protein